MDQKFWDIILLVRKEVNKQIEIARNAGDIGAPLEAEITIYCNLEIFTVLNQLCSELKFLLITSETTLILKDTVTIEVIVNCSNNKKCARCWHRVTIVDEQSLCDRCKINLTTTGGETRIYA
jgi:isoleucyl-tRNA synthetase